MAPKRAIETGFLDASRGLYQEHHAALGDVDSDPVLKAAEIRVEVADELRQLAGRVLAPVILIDS